MGSMEPLKTGGMGWDCAQQHLQVPGGNTSHGCRRHVEFFTRDTYVVLRLSA